MEKKKSKEEREKEREEFLNLQKEKQDLEDPTKRPAVRVSGWGSKLKPAKKDRMAEKQTIVRRKMP